jgi:hypothetical protein
MIKKNMFARTSPSFLKVKIHGKKHYSNYIAIITKHMLILLQILYLVAFRELNLTPHCVFYYGATTGISKKYQYNISKEYDTYRQCRWFWKGMKSHSARLTVSEEMPI